MDYRDIIESRYNREAWLQLLHDIFRSRVSFWREPSVVHASSRLAKQALNLGKISLADGESIAIYEVELTDNVDIERNRRGIRDMLTTDWRNMGYAGAFMFCYRQNESVLRFSYVSESWSFAEDGTYKKDSTDTRRFTYLLGEGHRSRTAIQQFEGLKKSNLSLKDLTKAFSVDAVSDMFFADYKQQYESIIAFITGKRMVKVDNKWEERVVGEPSESIFSEFLVFSDPEKAIRDYVKKLMGRLVFLQFLQKKGWLGVPVNAQWGEGDREFIQHLFENTADKDTFVDNVLEPLFNDINCERVGDIASLAVGKDIRVPYLNGGLFELDAADAVDFPLPARFMKSLLDFFASYNFTIDENDPDDAEMGVDPEMLGRIFENLLEDNKDKGAFYTPKEIVGYMCRESLIAYLQTDITNESQRDAIRQFVTTHKQVENLPNNVLQNLIDVKICDPAIGSGAFPMGLLKELYLCRAAIEGFDQNKAAEIKKHIIQQNIYGVDIERGAVDTARLRFWLALIVDEETPEALPNLDFKIMQGNSLLEEFNGTDLSNTTERKISTNGMFSIFDDMLDVYRKELRDMLEKYFNCTDYQQKKLLREGIISNVKKQLEEQGANCDFGSINLMGNDQFFLWHTWFYDVFSRPSKKGFDIVIGNPPYIDSETMTNLGLDWERRILQRKYSNLAGNWDIYMAFLELATSSGDVISFITPDKWLSKPFGTNFRKNVMRNRLRYITRAGSKVFGSATVDAIITLFIEESDSLTTSHFTTENHVSIITTDDIRNLESPYLIDFLFSEHSKLIQKIDNVKGKLIDLAECENACATSDFYVVRDLIEENKSPNLDVYYKLINTGTIEKFRDRWAEKQISYGGKFSYPVVKISSFNQRLGKSYTKRAASKKIIFKGLNLLDGCIDLTASIIPGKSTIVICNENIELLKFLLGFLNSKLPIFYIKTKYASSSYCGGITFSKEMINNFPLSPSHEIIIRITELVDEILEKKKIDPSSDIEKQEQQINYFVFKLYGLSYEEILIIDPNTRITKEEYNNIA